MEYQLKISPDAGADLRQIINKYEKEKQGLGLKFFDEVLKIETSLLIAPLRFPFCLHPVRKVNFRHFPCSIFFTVESDIVTICAIRLQNKYPGIWQERAFA